MGRKLDQEILAYQPEAVEIENTPVPGRIRWVLYLILVSIILLVTGASIFHVDRIVASQGELITTTPPLLVQPIETAVVRAVLVKVGDHVQKDMILATLDPTFTDADLNQLTRKKLNLSVQIRRMEAELGGLPFSPTREEGDEGVLQAKLLVQHQRILDKTRQMSDDKIAALKAQLELNRVKRTGLQRQQKLLRDVEGTTSQLHKNPVESRLRLLEAQKARTSADNELDNLVAEEQVLQNEIRQANSEFLRFVEDRNGELMEQQVDLLADLDEVDEMLRKASRRHELVTLRAPADGIVLDIAKRPAGSVLQPAEPFITLVPLDCELEVEAKVGSRDIGRIRRGDIARVKLDAFPFQRHGTLDGRVRVISEDAYQQPAIPPQTGQGQDQEGIQAGGYYKVRLQLVTKTLRDVPAGFRLLPGMKVRAEIKVGRRRVISYFLYPVIRALDEGLREP